MLCTAKWDLKIILHKWSSRQDDVSRTRAMLLAEKSRSQSALKLCAEASMKPVRVQPITLPCMVGFEKNFA